MPDPNPPAPPREPRAIRPYHWLAALPTFCMLVGLPWVNRVHPMIFGLPLLMAWIVFWIVLISVVMGVVLKLDHRADRDRPDA